MNSRISWMIGILALSIAGCGPSGPAMSDVSGTITLDGTPVSDGKILFRRTSGEQRGYEATITDGSYKLSCESGDVRIEIIAFRPVPGKFTTINGPKEPVMEMYIPAKYNTSSTLSKQLGKSNEDLSFQLNSKD